MLRAVYKLGNIGFDILFKKMRIAIEIDADRLRRIQTFTGQRKKSRAISRALAEYLDWQERREFVVRALSGNTDFSLTNDELEAFDVSTGLMCASPA